MEVYPQLNRIVDLIKNGKCKKIAFLTGAGISVGAGIPDFRSPGGMYDSLKPELLTATTKQRAMMKMDPTTVVCWDLFQENQLPYLELRRPFILGIAEKKWKATIGHFFIRLCHDKGILQRLYTQNIDGLDFQTEIPTEKIVGVHGSLGVIQCEWCKAEMNPEEFRKELLANIKDIYKIDSSAPESSTPIPCPSCGKNGLKPATVLYGNSIPSSYEVFESMQIDFPNEVDLIFVSGTSLTVSPANGIVTQVSGTCPRVIINNEKVGKFLGIEYDNPDSRDVFVGGSCDEIYLELIKRLGWLDDLKQFLPLLSPLSVELINKSS